LKIAKKIFDQEILMCKKLFKERKGCNWGKCKDCGVIPLLYKLRSGLLIERKVDIKKLKNKYLKN